MDVLFAFLPSVIRYVRNFNLHIVTSHNGNHGNGDSEILFSYSEYKGENTANIILTLCIVSNLSHSCCSLRGNASFSEVSQKIFTPKENCSILSDIGWQILSLVALKPSFPCFKHTEQNCVCVWKKMFSKRHNNRNVAATKSCVTPPWWRFCGS